MCEFCVKHGEGEKWYLQAKNYSDDLLSDIRRRRFIEESLLRPGWPQPGGPRYRSLGEVAAIHQGFTTPYHHPENEESPLWPGSAH